MSNKIEINTYVEFKTSVYVEAPFKIPTKELLSSRLISMIREKGRYNGRK